MVAKGGAARKSWGLLGCTRILREFIALVEKLGALRPVRAPIRCSRSAASPRSRPACRSARRCCSTTSRASRAASASSPTPRPIRSARRWRSASIRRCGRSTRSRPGWRSARRSKPLKPVTVKDARLPRKLHRGRRRRPRQAARRRPGTARTAAPIIGSGTHRHHARSRRRLDQRLDLSRAGARQATGSRCSSTIRAGTARSSRRNIGTRASPVRWRWSTARIRRCSSPASNICRPGSRNTSSPAPSKARRSRCGRAA